MHLQYKTKSHGADSREGPIFARPLVNRFTTKENTLYSQVPDETSFKIRPHHDNETKENGRTYKGTTRGKRQKKGHRQLTNSI